MDTNNLYGTIDTPKVVYQAGPNTPRGPMLPRFNTIKLAFIVVGLVLVGEIIWAGYTLSRPIDAQEETPKSVVNTQVPATHAQLTLKGPATAAVGETIKAEIVLNINEEINAGDIVLYYDPSKLQLQPNGNAAVTTGKIFSDYPINSVDTAVGKITLSGVTSLGKQGFTGQDTLGTVTFKVVGKGQTSLKFDYSKGSTKDTNIIGSTQENDILDGVTNLDLTLK
jgi:hypothetical protein